MPLNIGYKTKKGINNFNTFNALSIKNKNKKTYF